MRNSIALLRRGIVLSLGLALFSAPLAGCHDAPLPVAPTSFPSTGTGAGASSVAGLDIQSDSSSVAAGQTLPLSAVGSDDQGNPTSVTAMWSSSNASIATVSATGVVTGMHPGSVTITASAGGQTATLPLQVLAPGQTATTDPTQTGGLDGTTGTTTDSSSGLELEPAQPGVLVGGQLQMAAFEPLATQAVTIAWKSSNPSVAAVSQTGLVTGVAAGTVTISATSSDGLKAQAQLSVSAPVPSSQIAGIRILPSHVTMNVGDTFWLQAQVPTWAGAYDPNVRWEVGDPTILRVSATGQLTALAPGSTTVTAIALSYSGSQPLTAEIPVIVNNAVGSQ